MGLRAWTVRLSDPKAAGIHQPGRVSVMRLGGLHGVATLITGISPAARNPERERAWIVRW